MAHIVNLNAHGLTARRPGLFARIRAAVANRQKFALIFGELNRLTERELADLGMSRLNVPDIARQAAYGR